MNLTRIPSRFSRPGILMLLAAIVPSAIALPMQLATWSKVWVSLTDARTLVEDLRATTLVSLSPTFKEVEPGVYHVRTLNVFTTFSKYQIPLGQGRIAQTVLADSGLPVEISGGSLDPGMVAYLALKALNNGMPPSTVPESDETKLINYRISVAPRDGVTWGMINDQRDLSLSIETFAPGG